MKFYNQQHQYYCGIDLHARKMYVCILDQKGKTMVHENINTDPELLFQLRKIMGRFYLFSASSVIFLRE